MIFFQGDTTFYPSKALLNMENGHNCLEIVELLASSVWCVGVLSTIFRLTSKAKKSMKTEEIGSVLKFENQQFFPSKHYEPNHGQPEVVINLWPYPMAKQN